jgi:hypothetical protein
MRNGVVLPHPEGPTNQSLNGCFVMMRDDNNRHPNNKLWGDGWGWSWFNSDIYSHLIAAWFRRSPVIQLKTLLPSDMPMAWCS